MADRKAARHRHNGHDFFYTKEDCFVCDYIRADREKLAVYFENVESDKPEHHRTGKLFTDAVVERIRTTPIGEDA